jgi:hypothetical protein
MGGLISLGLALSTAQVARWARARTVFAGTVLAGLLGTVRPHRVAAQPGGAVPSHWPTEENAPHHVASI